MHISTIFAACASLAVAAPVTGAIIEIVPREAANRDGTAYGGGYISKSKAQDFVSSSPFPRLT
jgi:hypothetical protein